MPTPLENLTAAIKAGKVMFDSLHPIDKVVVEGTITITNDGNSGDYQTAKIESTTVGNPYGAKCLVNFSWSVDGTNFNGPDARLVYQYTVTPPGSILAGLRGAVSVGVSATEIKFRTANNYHGNVAGISFTPISQTFTIKYALYEVD